MTAVGVVGASARAAVHSLARMGLTAWAVDQFGDRDLTRVADCALCPPERYPEALPELAAQFPPGPFLYTGGLENYPHIIAELARTHELWGNPPDALARVRDPYTLFPVLAAAGWKMPRLVPAGQPSPAGRWLRKPLRSAGGVGVRFAQPGEAASPLHYFQQFIDGSVMSALYHDSDFLGVTLQLTGEPWLHARPFAYCGTIGPVAAHPLPAFPLPLRGMWGMDFILTGDVMYPLEVNSRYTAAAEVLEHARTRCPPPAGASIVGKAVYYAPHALTFPHSGPWDADLAGAFDPWRLPGFADIPAAGAAIHAGWPVLTFFARGTTPAEVRERLKSRAAELDRIFWEAQS